MHEKAFTNKIGAGMMWESLNFIKANLVSASICSRFNEETPNTSEATIVIRRCALLTRRMSCGLLTFVGTSCGLLMFVVGGGSGGGGGGGGGVSFVIIRKVTMTRFPMGNFV